MDHSVPQHPCTLGRGRRGEGEQAADPDENNASRASDHLALLDGRITFVPVLEEAT